LKAGARTRKLLLEVSLARVPREVVAERRGRSARRWLGWLPVPAARERQHQ
jgi:hypothetical protein